MCGSVVFADDATPEGADTSPGGSDERVGPLSGFVVGVTADRRSEEQAQLLERRGARVVHGATIRTLPLGDESGLREATEQVIADPPDAVLLITALGLRGWYASAESADRGEDLLSALAGARVYARGPKAAGAAMTAGLEVAWKAPNAVVTELRDQLLADDERGILAGRRVVIQLDGSDDSWLQEELRGRGFEVVEVPVYRWERPLDLAPAARLARSVADGSLDAITFTSGPAVDNFFGIADELGLAEQVLERFNRPDGVEAVCVGPVSGARCRSHGVDRTVVPANARLGAMVQACAAEFAPRRRVLQIGERHVVLQGRLVIIDGLPLMLSDIERATLAVLADRPGVVCSKASLLKAVWGPAETDVHVVEVAVGRLRQRLGPAGSTIETVVRRGYRLSVG